MIAGCFILFGAPVIVSSLLGIARMASEPYAAAPAPAALDIAATRFGILTRVALD